MLSSELTAAIDQEMQRALDLHGPLTDDNFRAFTIIGEELGELGRELLEIRRAKARGALIDKVEATVKAKGEAVQAIATLCHLVGNLNKEIP